MQPIFNEAKRLLKADHPFILASVVHTHGSTPQKPGAKLLVRADGSTVGTLGGGCVEADVWAEAKTILQEAQKADPGTSGGSDCLAQLRHFQLNEDIAAQDGLVCGGAMDILIDPVVGQSELLPLLEEIVTAYDGQGDRALATSVSPTQGGLASARMFVREDGSAIGSLGDPALDARITESALQQMPRGHESWLDAENGKKVYLETFTHPVTLVIAGGGHVGKALYSLATFLGFRTVIVDDRPRFANAKRFPEADKIIVDEFDRGLRSLNMGPNHCVIVATRGHKLDDIALLEAARSEAGYVGLLGSKRKAVLIFRDLHRAGIPEARIHQIHAPVGLDIGGRQPEEIAVSILAEILAERNGRSGGSMTMEERVVTKMKKIAGKT